MKFLLPPSETKRPGGDGAPLDATKLSLPELHERRSAVVDALVELASDEDAAQRVLKLSARQSGDIQHNRNLHTAPTMPAVDRYTGVLYDALDAATLSTASRRWLGAHVWIHSAPFGPVGALDGIPAYRLAAGTSLPGVPALRRHWADATTAAIAASAPSFVLDLRSEAYVALGPVPASVPSAYVRVVTEHGRALNHFNKKSKGLLLRALAEDRPRLTSLRSLRAWAAGRDVLLRDSNDPAVVELVVAE
ncbi:MULTISPECIES: YaaA family protein [unclassified Microbacterium]|uniref:YaaA family protein n=1 Tax=unclassified Microbacterium TaxID=2609290 RepID=UPI000EAA264D|nr:MULTISPECIES: peroxide stress protein YaaA [unclassified Microbacterium]MBT2485533.1 peroxide stress protein YaaA [Microbacterium sp. ISL-108]RKN68322.1 peroxide stress protein YaaA [Microbacterium sp. CGR2]